MFARHKLNSANMYFCLLMAGLVGLLMGSWTWFVPATIVIVAASVHTGAIGCGPGPGRPRPARGGPGPLGRREPLRDGPGEWPPHPAVVEIGPRGSPRTVLARPRRWSPTREIIVEAGPVASFSRQPLRRSCFLSISRSASRSVQLLDADGPELHPATLPADVLQVEIAGPGQVAQLGSSARVYLRRRDPIDDDPGRVAPAGDLQRVPPPGPPRVARFAGPTRSALSPTRRYSHASYRSAWCKPHRPSATTSRADCVTAVLIL